MHIRREAVRSSLGSYLAPRLGFVILVVLAFQYVSALLFLLMNWNVVLPSWLSFVPVQTTHFWFGIILTVLVSAKTGALAGKLINPELWRGGSGAAISRTHAVASILLVLSFLTLFVTGLGMHFRLYYTWFEVPFFQVRWLETHLWASVFSVPLVLWHLAKYLDVAKRVTVPSDVPSTGGAAPTATRRTIFGGILASSAVSAFAIELWPLQFLRYIAGPAWEQGYPVERVHGQQDVVDIAEWRLAVDGDVQRPLSLTYDQLTALPQVSHEIRIACVTGWQTVQTFTGVPVTAILEMAGATNAYQHVEFKSLSGYGWAWPRTDLKPEALIALRNGGETISIGHGFPVRLICPDRPGQANVKQLQSITVSLQPPPLKNSDLRIRG